MKFKKKFSFQPSIWMKVTFKFKLFTKIKLPQIIRTHRTQQYLVVHIYSGELFSNQLKSNYFNSNYDNAYNPTQKQNRGKDTFKMAGEFGSYLSQMVKTQFVTQKTLQSIQSYLIKLLLQSSLQAKAIKQLHNSKETSLHMMHARYSL